MVFTEPAVFLPGARIMLSPAQASVIPDPQGRYALIQCADIDPQIPFLGEGKPGGTRLLLYDAVTGDVLTVWRQTDGDRHDWRGGILSVQWLPHTDTALAIVSDRLQARHEVSPDDKQDYSLLLIRARLGSAGTRRIARREEAWTLSVSPHSPWGVLGVFHMAQNADGTQTAERQYATVNERGEVSQPLPVSPQASGGEQWSADGNTAYFIERIAAPRPAPTAPPGTPVPDAIRPTIHWYGYNVETKKLTSLDKRPAPDPPAAGDAIPTQQSDDPLRLVSAALTVPLPLSAGAPSTPAPSGTTGTPPAPPPAQSVSTLLPDPHPRGDTIKPLWLVRSDGKAEGYLPTSLLIAPDARRSMLLADDSAVLYVADAAVYSVPLTRRARPDFDALYRQYLRQVTMSQAKQIGLGMMMYAMDYDDKYPPGGDITGLLQPYLQTNDLFTNPSTGQPSFSYLLNGTAMANIASPATTAMGYLAGPGGRAIIYADGHVRWEDPPPAP